MHSNRRSSAIVLVALLLIAALSMPLFTHAATGVPRMLNYQGRLLATGGTLLGGSGTPYCFKFSFYDSATVGSGTKLWPTGSPSTMTATVRNGVFTLGIGDVSIGGDTLDFNFQDTDTAYLNVEVATKVGATCALGDGAETFETLSPRQRILASGYAINASMVGGFAAAQQASGNQVPVLSSGNLILGGTNPFLNATTTNALTLQGGGQVTGDIQFFSSANKITSAGNLTIAGGITAAAATTTNATSTNLFSALGRFTSAIIDTLSAVVATITNLTATNIVATNSTTTNATTTNMFASALTALAGLFGNITASTSASLSSTTAQGRLIAGTIVATSTATSSFAGPVRIGLTNSSYQFSILGSTTAASSATGTAVLAVTNSNPTLSSGSNILRLNHRTAFGTTCTTNTTCPRFIEYFVDVPDSADTGGRGVGSLRLSTAGTGITQTSGAADFAEYMVLNSPASVGDIVSLNSNGEYQRAVAGQSLIGVVSDNPAFVGNANLENEPNAYVVGFAGVIKTTVSTANGAISAGDFIAASTTAGVGVKFMTSGYTLGQALEAWSGPGTGQISVLVFPKFIDAAVALEEYGGSQGGASGYWNLATSTGAVTLASSTYALTLSNKLTAQNASTTNISATYASSTQGFFGSLSIGNLSGILRATAGAISTALVNLASDVTGILGISNGGTGTSTAPGYGQVLVGNAAGGYDLIATSSLGISSGESFSTTSVSYFASQGLAFSTTSNDYWKSVNNFFSTTSADYYSSLGLAFSTTSANYFVSSSSTIPKTYSTNIFTGGNTFSGALTANGAFTLGSLNGPLQANNGLVSATSSIGVLYGGTGLNVAPTFGQILVGDASGGYTLTATSSLGIPTFAYLFPNNATTTSLTFGGGLIAQGSSTVTNFTSTNSTSTNASSTNLFATIARLTNATTTSLGLTGVTSALLATDENGNVYSTTSISSSLLNTSGNWTGTFDGQEGSYYLANSFSTTSANYYSSLGLAFSTTSSDYWKSVNNFFSTTSSNYFSSQGLAFSTSSTDYYLEQNKGNAFSTTSANNFAHSSSTIAKTYTANTYTALQTFGNASTTNISASYASSTQGFFGSLSIGNLTGILRASAGAISTALVNLASDVTGILGISNGGTGTSTAPTYGQVLVGNAIGGYDLVATSSLGISSGGLTFAYPFVGNSTSTLLSFSSGLLATASSTIGNGAAAGGLTINGNATTTGKIIVQGSGTSTFANGIDVATGCVAVNGTCLGAGGGGEGSGVLVAVQTFTTPGVTTYTPSPGATIAHVIVTGGGGGGGGADAPTADTANETVGGGGGAGASSVVVVDVVATTSVQISVGAAGTAGANTGGTGGTGGQSRFSTFAIANGGVGGGGSAVNAACAAGSWGTAGTGGTASVGDLNVNGGDGHIGDCLAEVVFGGLGAASYWGGGGRGAQDPGANSCVAGTTAGAYGGGGGGAACEDSDVGATGGAGATGAVVVYEYGPFTGELGVTSGGTGTTTAPTYGQLLVGNGLGGYDLIATSSLNIAGIFSTTSASYFVLQGLAFSTTSNDYWQSQRNFFSTTSAQYFNSVSDLFSTTSANYFVHSSSTIPKTYSANTFTTLQTFGNASTTNISASYASSTQGFFGSLSVGSLTGVLKAASGVISTALVNLSTEVSGILQVANGGTGWGNIQSGTLLTGNGTGAVATTSVGSSLQLFGGTLSLNTGNSNTWTVLQSFSNASSSLFSAGRAYFGQTATTTIDTAGNVSVAGTLNVTGNTTLSQATTTNLMVTASSTFQDFTSRNATSSILYIGNTFRGAGLSGCSTSGDKLLWDATNGQFSCGTDAGAGSAITSLGAPGQLQTGASQTFASSSDTNLGITITSAGNAHTFAMNWLGTLSVARGGTGWGNIQSGTLVTGNGTGALATTSVGSTLQLSGGSLGLNLSSANLWSGLQRFGAGASTTALSANDFVAVGLTATTTIRGETNATSTFAGGIDARALNITSGSSTFANGINLTGGCFSVNGICLADTVVKLTAVNTFTSSQAYTKPTGMSYLVVEVWGGGGGGADGDGTGDGTGGGGGGGYAMEQFTVTELSGTTTPFIQVGAAGTVTASASGGTGGTSAFAGFATSTGGAGGVRTNGADGAGGAGGTGSGGDVNLTGAPGEYGDTVLGAGGNGGSAPRGGGGGLGGVGTGAAGAAGACGGGGGGSNGTGTVGGVGCVVIYEYTTVASGADLAENYPVTDPSIGPGDIVAFDAASPLVVTRASAEIKRPLVGIVATAPGIVLGEKDQVGQRPVALAGRVPTKVNLEGGPIQVGDRIALSSEGGVGRKANAFDDTVGTALSAYDGTQEEASVIVFVDLQRGIEIDSLGLALLGDMDGLRVISSSTEKFDFVDGVMHAISMRLQNAFGIATTTDETASSTASTTDLTATTTQFTGARTFIGAILAQIGEWFADASNGIGAIFANTLHAKNEICIDDQCLTKDDVRTLIEITRVPGEEEESNEPPTPVPQEPEQTPSPETSTSTPDAPVETSSSTSETSAPVSEPEQTPVTTSEPEPAQPQETPSE